MINEDLNESLRILNEDLKELEEKGLIKKETDGNGNEIWRITEKGEFYA